MVITCAQVSQMALIVNIVKVVTAYYGTKRQYRFDRSADGSVFIFAKHNSD